MEEVHKKKKLTQSGSHIFMSILTSHMKVIKIGQKYFLWTFWGFLVSMICDVKIDVNMCEPHYVKFLFVWTSSIVQVFDNLTLDIFLATWRLVPTLVPTLVPWLVPLIGTMGISRLILMLSYCPGPIMAIRLSLHNRRQKSFAARKIIKNAVRAVLHSGSGTPLRDS